MVIRTPPVRLVAVAAAALFCAACGGAHPASPAGPAQAPGGAPAAAGLGGQATQVAGVRGGSSGAAAGATGARGSAPGASAAHAGTASGPAAAAPGAYPITGSYSATWTAQPTPSQTSGGGTLTVAAPQSTSAGSEQDQTYGFGSDNLVTHEVYAAGGEVLVTRSGSASFSPPLPIVPAGLHGGMAWGPVSFTSDGASGTLSGSAGQSTQATVGGVAVTVVPITLHLRIDGSYHGTPYSATSVETLSWAPSLHLAVHLHMSTDAHYATAGTYHSDLDVSLLSTRPG